MLDVQADDLTEVDIAGLEADAVAEKGQTPPLPAAAAAVPLIPVNDTALSSSHFQLAGSRAAAYAAT